MTTIDLVNAKTFSEFLNILDIRTDDNVSYDEFSCDSAARMSKTSLMQNFLFDKDTAQRVYDAFACVRKVKKIQKPAKIGKSTNLSSILASAFGFNAQLPTEKFSEAFNCLDDVQFFPGDEWPMDLCTAAESASNQAFMMILGQCFKTNRGWRCFTNKEGWSPLMYAVALGRIKVVDVLLKNEVSLKVRSKTGLTALMLAASFGHEKIIERLILHAQKNAQLFQMDSKATMVKELLTVDYTDNRGYSALHYAAYYNQVDALKLLLKEGADPNMRDSEGMTPALVACKDESQEACLRILVDNGGDLEIRNNEGKTGYDIAGTRPIVFEIKSQSSRRILQTSCPDNPKYNTYGSF